MACQVSSQLGSKALQLSPFSSTFNKSLRPNTAPWTLLFFEMSIYRERDLPFSQSLDVLFLSPRFFFLTLLPRSKSILSIIPLRWLAQLLKSTPRLPWVLPNMTFLHFEYSSSTIGIHCLGPRIKFQSIRLWSFSSYLRRRENERLPMSHTVVCQLVYRLSPLA